MTVLARIRCSPKATLALGLFLCSLLWAFAVMAKTSMYHDQQQVHSLTATKVWQKNASEPVKAVRAVVVPVAVAALLLLLKAPESAALLPVPARRTSAFLNGSFSPRLAVRPPPARR